MDYKIIASGSQGNAVLIDDLLVDCGISFKKLGGYDFVRDNIKYIFITHKHSDHCNIVTLKRIKKDFPHIEIYCNWETAEHIGDKVEIKKIFGSNLRLLFPKYTLKTIELLHDVENHGFIMYREDGTKLVYATDTNNLDNFPTDTKYDYFFIESNHDAKKLEKLARTDRKSVV